MNFSSALTVLSHARDDDIDDVIKVLCTLATLDHFLGQGRRRDDTVETAAELLRSVLCQWFVGAEMKKGLFNEDALKKADSAE
jgi:hypothetical protein